MVPGSGRQTVSSAFGRRVGYQHRNKSPAGGPGLQQGAGRSTEQLRFPLSANWQRRRQAGGDRRAVESRGFSNNFFRATTTRERDSRGGVVLSSSATIV